VPIYILVIILFFQLICIAPASAENERIDSIVVRGNSRIETSTILNAIRIKPGETISGEKTSADIRSIYKTGHFQDVTVSLEELAGKNILVYTVAEKPVIRDIKFEGNKEITLEKLKENVEIQKNTILSAKNLDKSVAKIKKLYGDEGYYLATVVPIVEKRPGNNQIVTFRITEGNKILIRKIHFDGNRAFPDSKLKSTMETKEKWFMSWLTGAGTYKEEVLKNDAMLIADFYMNNGYMNIKVGEPTLRLNQAKDALDVYINLTEGEQFRVGTLDFKGDLLEPVSVLRKKLKAEPGQIFSRAVMRNDITTLTDLYADKGYAFANVNPLTQMNMGKKVVDVTFDMEKGDLVHLERINITGNPKTRDKVIRREMRVTERELYSSTGIKRSKQNIMNTGYFEEANISTAKGSSADRLNVNVNVKEKPTGSFSVGGGYSSLDGVIGQASIQQSNFLGRGLKANLSGSIGGKSQTYSLGLTDPYFLDTKWTLGGDIYRSERDYLDYTRRLTGVDVKAGYPINDNLGTFFMYKYEVKDIYDPIGAYKTLHFQNELDYPLGRTTTSSIFASITRNTTDYRLDPSTGMVNAISAEYAGLGGSNKFGRYITDNVWFHPLYKKLIFSTKLTLGYVQNVGSKVPIDEKFYLGGIYSLRGYKTRTVSPLRTVLVKQNNGDQYKEDVYLGGNAEYFGNAELTFPLLPEVGIKGVMFFDYGNAFNINSGNFPTTLMSCGGGIRWASPMGPLRLEYGIPINPRRSHDNSGGRLEFAIGTLF